MKEPDENQGFSPGEKDRIAYLVAGFLEKNLTGDEEVELDEWINTSERNQRLFDDLIDPDKLKQAFDQLDSLDIRAAWQRIEQRRSAQPPARSAWLRYAAAAAILVLAGFAIFYFVTVSKNTLRNDIVNNKADILPGTNTATLTLADGSTINLTDLPNGIVERETATGIKKINDGELVYDAGSASSESLNTLTTPRGGQYGVILPDGSKIMLNADSWLRYPLSFKGSSREVELSGEAFFEITKDSRRPFIVKTAAQQVQVLGTHFNVNAYADDPITQTTLVEGSVKITAGGKQQILSPGYQAVSDAANQLTVHQPEMEEVIAWKEGNFEFINTPIETIMKQVARWYDAEIVYSGNVPYHFNASISRNVPVSKLLQLLEATGRVHFTIDGKKIIVTP